MTGTGHPATPALPRAPRAPTPLRLPRLRRRTFTTLAVVVVVGIVALNVGRQSFLGLSVEQQAADLQAQVEAAQAENAALQRYVAYLQSDAYVTAEARRLRNLGYAGEQVLIIPPGAAVPVPGGEVQAPVEVKPLLEQWVELFFGAAPAAHPATTP
jgi:cell division protein FtsB